VMTVDLVSIAPPAAVEQKPEAKPEPVAPPPQPPQPQPQPEPQPETKPIVKNPASNLKKLLAEKLKKQRQERERESSSRPTPTARNLAQLVPTVPPLDVREVPPVTLPAAPPRQSRQGPVAVEGPAGLERYDYYLSAIRSNLHRNWSVPRVNQANRMMAVAQINILRTGRIENFQITRRSGNDFFDQSVREAITASRFPPFADDYPDNRMSVTVRFRPEGD
jgi:TonB family protein